MKTVVMMQCYGEKFDVDSVLKKMDDIVPEYIWRKGERGIKKKEYQYSGFKFAIADEEVFELAIKQTTEALKQGWIVELSRLIEGSAVLVLDFGLIDCFFETITKTIRLPASLLKEVEKLRMDIEITIYPSSD